MSYLKKKKAAICTYQNPNYIYNFQKYFGQPNILLQHDSLTFQERKEKLYLGVR